jgi:hypothetical protein
LQFPPKRLKKSRNFFRGVEANSRNAIILHWNVLCKHWRSLHLFIGVEVVPENAILSALEFPPKSLEKSLVFNNN